MAQRYALHLLGSHVIDGKTWKHSGVMFSTRSCSWYAWGLLVYLSLIFIHMPTFTSYGKTLELECISLHIYNLFEN